MSEGKLILGSSHLGNPNLISYGMKSAIEEADIIIIESEDVFKDMCERLNCEPTTNVVAKFLGLNTNEEIGDFKEFVMTQIKEGQTVLIVPMAGQAGIGDPAIFVAQECHALGVTVDIIPGPSLSTIAFLKSGFGDGSYSFEAQLQPEPGVFGYLQEIIKQNKAAVYIEPNEGLEYFFKTVIPFYGKKRKAAIMVDLTLPEEKIYRGTLWDLWEKVENKEIAPHIGRSTIVVDGSSGWHHDEGLQQPLRPKSIDDETYSDQWDIK